MSRGDEDRKAINAREKEEAAFSSGSRDGIPDGREERVFSGAGHVYALCGCRRRVFCTPEQGLPGYTKGHLHEHCERHRRPDRKATLLQMFGMSHVRSFEKVYFRDAKLVVPGGIIKRPELPDSIPEGDRVVIALYRDGASTRHQFRLALASEVKVPLAFKGHLEGKPTECPGNTARRAHNAQVDTRRGKCQIENCPHGTGKWE